MGKRFREQFFVNKAVAFEFFGFSERFAGFMGLMGYFESANVGF